MGDVVRVYIGGVTCRWARGRGRTFARVDDWASLVDTAHTCVVRKAFLKTCDEALHAFERFNHEQAQAVVDDLLERLARVHARVHGGKVGEALVELGLHG